MQLIIAVLIAVLIYGLQYRLYRNLWDEKLDIDIRFDEIYMDVGERNSLTEIITNSKFLPLPVFHVKYATSRSFKFDDCENASITDMYHRNDVFSIMVNQKVTRKLYFTATKRGFYTVNSLNVIAKDFFMTKTFAKSIPNYSEVYVFPKKNKNAEFISFSNGIMGEIETEKSLCEDPFSFRGIREYEKFDTMSRINWRATAKTDKLMVNQYSKTSEYRVKLLLNLDNNNIIKTDYMKEKSIELTSSLAKEFLKHKFPIMLASNGLDVVEGTMGRVEFGSSMNHLLSIDKYLARIGSNKEIDQFITIIDRDIRKLEDRITYVIVSSYCREDLLIKLDYMVKKGVTLILIVPYYDKYGFVPSRPYMKGWEVKLDEG